MVLNALLNGKIFPAEQIDFKKIPGFTEKMQEESKIMEVLKKNLSKEDMTLVEECCVCNQDMGYLMSEEYFKYGLAIGMKLSEETEEVLVRYKLASKE